MTAQGRHDASQYMTIHDRSLQYVTVYYMPVPGNLDSATKDLATYLVGFSNFNMVGFVPWQS